MVEPVPGIMDLSVQLGERDKTLILLRNVFLNWTIHFSTKTKILLSLAPSFLSVFCTTMAEISMKSENFAVVDKKNRWVFPALCVYHRGHNIHFLAGVSNFPSLLKFKD
jgi:hypothetical protein